MSLSQFLSAHAASKDKPSTHTRIPGPGSSPGTYSIVADDLGEFFKQYHKAVIVSSVPEFLTEKQFDEGPLAIDIDFRYKEKERVYTAEDIQTFIHLVFEELCNIYCSVRDISVYVMEKTSINATAPPVIKDGIHFIFGASMDKTCKEMLRNRLLQRLGSVWDHLVPHLVNDWESVLDRAVLLGTNNWQMYGSRKPGCEPYKLTKFYTVDLNLTDGNVVLTQMPLPNVTVTYLPRLSVQYTEYPVLGALKDDVVDDYDRIRNKTVRKVKPSTMMTMVDRTNDPDVQPLILNNAEETDAMIAKLFENATLSEYRYKEYFMYAMLLPVEYYGPGSYEKWIRVGWAMKNISHRLFPCFVKFCSQSPTFHYSQVNDLYVKWCSWAKPDPSMMLTGRSLMYWARKANPEGFQEVIQETQSYYVEEIIRSPETTEYDVAVLMHHIYKDFVCSGIKHRTWYEFRDHRWREVDSGITLQSKISSQDGIWGLFAKRLHECTTEMSKKTGADGPSDQEMKRNQRISKIMTELRKTDKKSNVMREAAELYYTPDFVGKLDSKPYILCFTNCVVDFSRDVKEGLNRPGAPEDFTCKCTDLPYEPIRAEHADIVQEIVTFFEQLFPNPELRAYMWAHLASSLIGKIINQTFNIYLGSGRNGKSVMVDLMGKVLGNYKATVPISLITQKRVGIGASSSEVAQLVGVRYAVMQEPSKNDRLNEGVLKELTGGDQIQARALFKDSITFKPQLKLAVCTNTLFDGTNCNDEGFWRRIRVVVFQSVFCENPVDTDAARPYQFKVDKHIDHKFETWKTVFIAMLVDKAKETMGNVEDCDAVMRASNEYREEQDSFSEFIRTCIMDATNGSIKQNDLVDAFGFWWKNTHSSDARAPSSKDLLNYISRRYGNKIAPQGGTPFWRGIALIRPEEDLGEDPKGV